MKRIALVLLVLAAMLGVPQSASAAWTQVYRQDFNQSVALGGWPGPYAGNVNALEGCCEAGGNTVWYNSKQTLSVHDGVLDAWAHKRLQPDGNWRIMGSWVSPTVPNGDNILYGRIIMRMGVFPEGPDGMQNWWVSNLLFAKSNVWADGEVNWPESEMASYGVPVAFVHDIAPKDPHNNCSIQYNKAFSILGWHTYYLDWTPSGFGFYIQNDGGPVVQIGSSSCALPTKPMNYVSQVGTIGHTPTNNAHGRVLWDYIAIDSYMP
jgi:hypothetical protein